MYINIKTVRGFTTDNTFEDRINTVLKQIYEDGNIVLRITPVQVDVNSLWVMIEYEPDIQKTATIEFSNVEAEEKDDNTRVYTIKQPIIEQPIFYNDSKTSEFEHLPIITTSKS